MGGRCGVDHPALSGLGCLELEGLCEVCSCFLLTFESTDIVCPELCLLGEGDVLGVGGQGGHALLRIYKYNI